MTSSGPAANEDAELDVAALRDPARLAAIASTHLLADGVELHPALARLTRLAARALRAPVAQVNVVTDDAQVPVASAVHAERLPNGDGAAWSVPVGLDASYCQHVVVGSAPLLIEDARAHPLVRDNRGTTESGIVAYAAVPLRAPNGAVLGSVCVVDFQPRRWTADDLGLLEEIAMVAGDDIAARAGARSALESHARRVTETADAWLRDVFAQAPLAVAVMTGPEHVYAVASPRYLEIIGRRDVVGKPVRAALAELEGQGIFEILDRVFASGRPYTANERMLRLDRDGDGATEEYYYNLAYQPLRDAEGTVYAVASTAVEVTDAVRARRDVDAANALLQDQAVELEMANEQLRDASAQLEEQQLELELANQQLHDAIAEQEAQTQELQATTIELEAKTAEADAARARAEGILESVADAYFLLDAGFRFAAANGAMERNLQVRREDILGRTIWEVYPGTVGNDYERNYRRVVEQREEAHFTLSYSYGGLDIVTEVDAYPAAGGGAAVFWRDVTERQRIQAALTRRERELRTLADTIPTLAWSARADGHVEWYNARWYEYTGTTPEQMTGWGWQRVHHPDRLPDVLALWTASIESGEPLEMTFPMRRADGEYRAFLTRVAPVRDADGQVVRWFGTSTDVEEVQRARAEAERARAEAEEANRAKTDFLTTMSHELRTPLNAILGYAELLAMGLRGPVSAAQHEDLVRIQRANQHLMALITDILNFARLDAGRLEFHVEPVRIGPLVADLETLVRPQLAAQGLEYDHDSCAPDTPERPHVVRADPERLRQILLNLLSNAIKFTDRGGRVSIDCEDDVERGVVRLKVRDTGRGIPADRLEHIFDPFVQVDRHRTQGSQQGVGLGLAISRELAVGMHGDISVESAVGEGSTFTLTLPRA